MRRVLHLIAHGLILACGLLALLHLTRDARPRWRGLVTHLASDGWEIRSNRAVIEARLRQQYASEPRKFLIHFAAGTPHSLTLHDARAETIQTIGSWVLKDNPQLSANLVSLPSAYGSMLAAAAQELATRANGRDRTALEALAAALGGTDTPAATHANLERANQILARLPRTDALRQAVDAYRRHELPRIGTRAFQVATDPEFDVEDSWERKAIALEQENQCRASLAPTDGGNETMAATVGTFPRITEIALVRPWLSDALLDEVERRGGAVSAKFFGDSREGLRIIPVRIWVMLGEEFEATDLAVDDRKRLDSWFQRNVCCTVKCDAVSVNLKPAPIFRTKDGVYRFRVAEETAVLYAIVSRRREPL